MRFGAFSGIEDAKEMDYGCLSYGFSGMDKGLLIRELPFEAKVFGGPYEEIIKFARENGKAAKAAVVMTDGAGGENGFVKAVSSALDCPVAGGGAARPEGVTGEGLFKRRGEADICLLFGDTEVRAVVKNIHTHVLEECDLEYEDPRILKKINGEDASLFLRKKKEEYSFTAGDFEHMTLSTLEGVNAHMSEDDGIIRSGRDIEKKMLLRYVAADEVQKEMEDFYRENDNSLVFGCAGLKGITPERFSCGSLGMFLFGEICALGEYSEFGNLMLSKIVY